MDLSKSEFLHAYSPYRKEATRCLAIDVLVSFLCGIILFIVGIQTNAVWTFWVIPIYFFIELFVNYKFAILSLIEEKNKCVVLAVVTIEKKEIEDSASGRWGSIIPRLYPKELHMQRYKITCTDESGKKILLRSVMSINNAKLFNKMLETTSMCKRTIIAGKYSHIILKYCDRDDFALILNRRT